MKIWDNIAELSNMMSVTVKCHTDTGFTVEDSALADPCARLQIIFIYLYRVRQKKQSPRKKLISPEL